MSESRDRFDNIDAAIRDIKRGKFVILVDDEDRENEGDLVIAAQHARGLICLALTSERVEELHLPQQAVENTATFGTAFTRLRRTRLPEPCGGQEPRLPVLRRSLLRRVDEAVGLHATSRPAHMGGFKFQVSSC